MNAHDVAEVIAGGGPIRTSGDQFIVRCPAHPDDNPSLAIRDGERGVVMHCHAGCEPSRVMGVVGLAWADLSGDEPSENHVDVAYRYEDENGNLLFEVVRGPHKKFLQRRPDPSQLSGYRWDLRGVERVLYHLPEVIRAREAGQEIWITEGEKDADAVRAHGITATTNPGGAGKWRDSYPAVLADARVTIWADNDEVGRKHAREVREALLPVASQVRIVESEWGKDASDHLGHGLHILNVQVTVPYERPDVQVVNHQADEYIDQDFTFHEWAIPTILRKHEVLMVTGFEGHGKSSLLKQIAVTAACGSHPFNTLLPIRQEPSRVLYVDCENSREDCIEDFRRLRQAAQFDEIWDTPELWIYDRPGMALDGAADLGWLLERVQVHEPDLLVIGPIYRLVATDIAKEEAVRTLMRAIDMVQEVSECGVALEHHPPHRNAGEARSVRPIGSSLLMRWPSFGFGLRPTVEDDPDQPFEFKSWRGARRRGRSWPGYMRQANRWFWEEVPPDMEPR